MIEGGSDSREVPRVRGFPCRLRSTRHRATRPGPRRPIGSPRWSGRGPSRRSWRAGRDSAMPGAGTCWLRIRGWSLKSADRAGPAPRTRGRRNRATAIRSRPSRGSSGGFTSRDPAEESDPDLPPFQGGLIGFVGLTWLRGWNACRAGRRADSRMPDIRMALYDTAIAVDAETGLAYLHAWDLTGEGRPAAVRRCRPGAQGDRSGTSRAPPRNAPAGSRPSTSQLVRTRRVPGDGCVGAGVHRRRGRVQTSRSGSRPAGRSIRWTSTSACGTRAPHPLPRSCAGATWRWCRPAPNGSTRRGATASSRGR